MTSATITKIVGTIASAVVASSAEFIPQQWKPLALAAATLILGWLHLPRPGDVPKAAS